MKFGHAIVEDINDPLQVGRVRARDVHLDGTKQQIPTEKLPWMTILTPMTGVGMQGVAGAGHSPIGIKPGATIVFLYDPANPEYRIAVGTVPVSGGQQ